MVMLMAFAKELHQRYARKTVEIDRIENTPDEFFSHRDKLKILERLFKEREGLREQFKRARKEER